MVVTPFGIVIFVREEQFSKALNPIEVNLEGRVMEESLLQDWNALLAMVVSMLLDGIDIFFN